MKRSAPWAAQELNVFHFGSLEATRTTPNVIRLLIESWGPGAGNWGYIWLIYGYITSRTSKNSSNTLPISWSLARWPMLITSFLVKCPSNSVLRQNRHVEVRSTSVNLQNMFWLVVWLPWILHFPINIGLLSSSQLTNSYFSEGWPKTTNQCLLLILVTGRGGPTPGVHRFF